ncbi:MAG: ARMT1-like domain-containing protein [Candidatus Bipolaricaulota bacterium]|nr:ARMT1-like domain-containing protein [Candidatus Bipolaricaulota bacterium]
MRTYPECIPCILQASLNAGRLAGADEEQLWQALAAAAAEAARWPRERPPIALGAAVAARVREKLGTGDPFHRAKREGNAKLLQLYPALRARVRSAPDPLDAALHLAAAANALDLGVYGEIDFVSMLERAWASPRGRWDLPRFREHLAKARTVLYLADNAGEIVADRILIEELLAQGKAVTLAVRGGPILNDVTLEDLADVGLPKEVEVITTGSDLPGVFLPLCAPEFRARFARAELVVSKGMGNFEGLAHEPGPIFFVFQAKCGPVAWEAGVGLRELVLLGPGAAGLPKDAGHGS